MITGLVATAFANRLAGLPPWLFSLSFLFSPLQGNKDTDNCREVSNRNQAGEHQQVVTDELLGLARVARQH